jgi:hypothetical protein
MRGRAPNYYVYRVDEGGVQLISRHCDFPGEILPGRTGPEVVPDAVPDEWECQP